MLKFSLGPWKIDEVNYSVIDANGDDVQLRRFALASGSNTEEDREIVRGNTRLAVASPMLYLALKRIVDEFDTQIGKEHVDEYYKDARKVLESLE